MPKATGVGRREIRRIRVLLTLVAICCPIAVLVAQEAPPLDPGSRIRVTVVSPEPGMRIGTYLALTDTTLRLQDGAAPFGIPIATIGRLESSRGRKPSVLGGVLGFVLGGAAGGALGCLANRDDYGVFCAGQDDTKVIVGAALGGAAGAALGALLFRRERWSTVDLARLRAP